MAVGKDRKRRTQMNEPNERNEHDERIEETDAAAMGAERPSDPQDRGQSAHDATAGEEEAERIPYEEAQAIDAEPRRSAERAVTTWQPEDAANFLAKAIREAQAPYAKAMQRSTVPSYLVGLIVVVLAIIIGGLFYLLRTSQSELETARQQLAEARGAAGADERDLLQSLNKQIRGLEKDKAELSAEVNSLEKDLMRKDADLAGMREKLTTLRTEAHQLREDLRGARNKLAEVEDQATEQEEVRARLREVEAIAEDAIAEAKQHRQAANLLQEQLNAQNDATEALRRQLTAARKLIFALRGEDPDEAIKKEQNGGEAAGDHDKAADEAPGTTPEAAPETGTAPDGEETGTDDAPATPEAGEERDDKDDAGDDGTEEEDGGGRML
jgi:DNA repair exonuclease SbcCD ATPase subunit